MNVIWHVVVPSTITLSDEIMTGLYQSRYSGEYVTPSNEVASMCKLAGARIHQHKFFVYTIDRLECCRGLTFRSCVEYGPYKYIYTTLDYKLVREIESSVCDVEVITHILKDIPEHLLL